MDCSDATRCIQAPRWTFELLLKGESVADSRSAPRIRSTALLCQSGLRPVRLDERQALAWVETVLAMSALFRERTLARQAALSSIRFRIEALALNLQEIGREDPSQSAEIEGRLRDIRAQYTVAQSINASQRFGFKMKVVEGVANLCENPTLQNRLTLLSTRLEQEEEAFKRCTGANSFSMRKMREALISSRGSASSGPSREGHDSRVDDVCVLLARVKAFLSSLSDPLLSTMNPQYVSHVKEEGFFLLQDLEKLLKYFQNPLSRADRTLDGKIWAASFKVEQEERVVSIVRELCLLSQQSGISLPSSLEDLLGWVSFVRRVPEAILSPRLQWLSTFDEMDILNRQLTERQKELEEQIRGGDEFENQTNRDILFRLVTLRRNLTYFFSSTVTRDISKLCPRYRDFFSFRPCHAFDFDVPDLHIIDLVVVKNDDGSDSIVYLPPDDELTRWLRQQLASYRHEWNSSERDGQEANKTKSQRAERLKLAFLDDILALGLRLPKGLNRPQDVHSKKSYLRLVARANHFRKASGTFAFLVPSDVALIYEEERVKEEQAWLNTLRGVPRLEIIYSPKMKKVVPFGNITQLMKNRSYEVSLVPIYKPPLDLQTPLLSRQKSKLLLSWGKDVYPTSREEVVERCEFLRVKKRVPYLPQVTAVTLPFTDSPQQQKLLVHITPLCSMEEYLSNPSTNEKSKVRVGFRIAHTIARLHELGFTVKDMDVSDFVVFKNKNGSESLALLKLFAITPIASLQWFHGEFVAPEQYMLGSEGRLSPLSEQSDMFAFAHILSFLKWGKTSSGVLDETLLFSKLCERGEASQIVRHGIEPEKADDVLERFERQSEAVRLFAEDGEKDPVDHLIARMFSFDPDDRPSFPESISVLKGWLEAHP